MSTHEWIDLQFDTGARKAAFERIRAQLTDPATRTTLDALEKGYADVWYECLVQDNFLQFCDEMVHDIASSMPAPGDVFPNTRAAGNMARYWRWALFEDCMADTPYQVERVMQALVGTAFDAARRESSARALCLDLVASLDVLTNIGRFFYDMTEEDADARRAAVARAEALIERAKEQLANDTPT